MDGRNRADVPRFAANTGPLFSMPDFTSEKNVVTADGQTIAAKAGKYRTLFILGAATNGSQQGTLSLAYGQAVEEATLNLSDWCGKPAYGEVEAASFPRVGEHEKIDCKLFIQKIPLDASRELTAITLPKNKDIHIFAMTLAK